MPLFQYAGFQFNFNCKLHFFHALVSSLIFVQAVQTLGSIAGSGKGSVSWLCTFEKQKPKLSIVNFYTFGYPFAAQVGRNLGKGW